MVFAFIREPKAVGAGEQAPGLLSKLREVLADPDRSALRLLLAIFFWFLGYTAVEAFFTLYAVNHLGLANEDGVRLLGQLSLMFVLFALPAGYIGARIGRRATIVIGILILGSMMLGMFLLPAATLTTRLFAVPVLGEVPVAGLMLMAAGIGWALININSLPMVVDKLVADGRRYDERRPNRHVHRPVLHVLDILGDHRAERERLDHPVDGQQLQPCDDRGADLHGRRPCVDAWRAPWRGCVGRTVAGVKGASPWACLSVRGNLRR